MALGGNTCFEVPPPVLISCLMVLSDSLSLLDRSNRAALVSLDTFIWLASILAGVLRKFIIKSDKKQMSSTLCFDIISILILTNHGVIYCKFTLKVL